MSSATIEAAPTIVVVGDIVTDILATYSGEIAGGSDTPAQIAVTGGGSAANTAAWLARVGVEPRLVGVVGDDVAGTDRLAELTASGVDCSFVRSAPSAATGSVIVLAHGHERSFLCDRGANHLLAPADVEEPAVGATHLHLSGYTLLDASSRPAGLHALEAAKRRGLTTSVDAASSAPLRRVGAQSFLDWIRGVDVLFANADEAELLGEPHDIPNVVVKRGAEGAQWRGTAHTATVPAVPAPIVVDTTGAGDAFAAGFLEAWLRGEPPEACLTAGARLGAEAVGVLGGRPTPRR